MVTGSHVALRRDGSVVTVDSDGDDYYDQLHGFDFSAPTRYFRIVDEINTAWAFTRTSEWLLVDQYLPPGAPPSRTQSAYVAEIRRAGS